MKFEIDIIVFGEQFDTAMDIKKRFLYFFFLSRANDEIDIKKTKRCTSTLEKYYNQKINSM